MRRLRHSLCGPRRRAARLLRALRAPAPRPGVGRNRRVRRRTPHRPSGHGPRHPGLRRAEAARTPRRPRDRAHALLHHRLDPLDERAAPCPARTGAHGGARAQREPDERDRPARRARGGRDPPGLDLRYGGDRRARRRRRVAARRRGRRRDAPAGGRVLRRRALGGEAARLPRRARIPPPVDRPARRGLGRRLRDLRARPRRRRRGARGRARGTRSGGRPGAPLDSGRRASRRRRALPLRVLLPRAARLAARRGRGARRSVADGRAPGGGGACRGRPRPAHPRLGDAGRDRLLARPRHPVQRGPDQEPLRRPHVHPARPGAARAGRAPQVQPARRGRRQAPGGR